METCDIVLAATLKVCGFKLWEIKVVDRKGTFIFGVVPSDFLDEYNTGNCLVEPVALNYAIKTLTTSVRRSIEEV